MYNLMLTSLLFLYFLILVKERCRKVTPLPPGTVEAQGIHRSESTTEFHPAGEEQEVEYFFASDAR